MCVVCVLSAVYVCFCSPELVPESTCGVFLFFVSGFIPQVFPDFYFACLWFVLCLSFCVADLYFGTGTSCFVRILLFWDFQSFDTGNTTLNHFHPI